MDFRNILLGIFFLTLAAPQIYSASTNEQKLAKANFEFALDMYKQLTTKFGNVFISPLSISTALAMVYLGAEGSTKEEMADVMKWSSVDNFLHNSMKNTMAEINSGSKDYVLAIANRLYGRQSGGSFKSTYLARAKALYNAEPKKVDFCKTVETAKIINGWVASKTNEKIKDLVPASALSCSTLSVLVNAVYFNGTWKFKFDKAFTKRKPFTTLNGETVKTDMMELNPQLDRSIQSLKDFKVYEGDDTSLLDAQILQLPYKGDNLSMYIVLPNANNGLKKIESQVTATKLNQIIDNQMVDAGKYVKVVIPKFTMKLKYTLKDPFVKLGMRDLFSAACNLSGMTDADAYVSHIFHDTYVSVNEEGTEAAGATAVVIRESAILKPPEFVADHPFMFFIRDERSKSVLFYGRYVDPKGVENGVTNQPNSVPQIQIEHFLMLFIFLVISCAVAEFTP